MEWRRGEVGAVSEGASYHVLTENEYPSFPGRAPRRAVLSRELNVTRVSESV